MKLLTTPGQGKRLSSMEGLRAYAAGIVFLFHAALLMQEYQHANGRVIDWMLHSQYGVDIFFLLSGYLIAGLVAKDSFRFGSYLLHRIVRIYPALLGMLVLCTAGLWLLRGELPSTATIIGNVLLLNGAWGLGVEPINNVTWSLFFEFAFYLTFPVLFRTLGLARTMVLCAAVIVMLGHIDTRFVRFAFFFAGVWLRLRDDTRPWATEPIAIAIYIGVTTATIYLQKYLLFLAFYLPAATLMVDHALHSRGTLHRLLSWPALRVLGNVSYSFYLLHPIGLLIARYVVEALQLRGTAWCIGLLLIGFSVSLPMAAASYWTLERPYFKYRHLLERRRSAIPRSEEIPGRVLE